MLLALMHRLEHGSGGVRTHEDVRELLFEEAKICRLCHLISTRMIERDLPLSCICSDDRCRRHMFGSLLDEGNIHPFLTEPLQVFIPIFPHRACDKGVLFEQPEIPGDIRSSSSIVSDEVPRHVANGEFV